MENNNKEFDNSIILKVGAAITIVLIILFVIVSCSSKSSYEKIGDTVWDKDPNSWSEEEKDYVNDFYNWYDEKDKYGDYKNR